ncbi:MULTISPECIES: FAD binding domain-containing protein [Burkholderia]|uniref:Monooxygenase n=1 Tax=Burkholderia aenigmatica TaxID=2015348 RepID=A0A6J5INN0_9BURK|nr:MULTISPECIES: FAD binding domain-containing protein [Burkholderia]CAB3961267.1 monooxygenase [Burkholderia aenigmatica]
MVAPIKNRPRALIIGGSLGGLFTATTLQAAGWDIDIFERSPNELDSRGGGIVLQADVLSAFHFAGIQTGTALGVQSGDRIYLDRADRVIQRSFMPQTQTSWNMLYGTMKAHLPAQVFHPGEHFIRFEQNGDRITAYFASGRVETGDLLVGADGARSAVREQVSAGLSPNYAGYVAWRGLVPETALPASAADVLNGTFAFQQGPGHLMLEYLVPGEDLSTQEGQRRWNWVWYRKVAHGEALTALLTDRSGIRHSFSLPPGAPKDEDLARLTQASKELLAPTFQTLVEATREPFVQAILDLQVKQMVYGRAILLGDAAFVPRPHTAGSTAKAAANALALAQALHSADAGIDEALSQWQAGQLHQGIGMTEWGMNIGDRIMGIPRSNVVLKGA